MKNANSWLACTILVFLSALLSFSLQPMTGRILLPYVGGAPMGWLVTLFFFQTAFLAGYALSHLLGRFGARTPIYVAALFILAGLAATYLPMTTQGLTDPALLLGYLATSVGLQTVGLAMTGPAVQALVARSTMAQAANPYPLYAISNLGSFLGLLGYPLVIEPLFDLDGQAVGWSVLAAILAALMGFAALRMQQAAPVAASAPVQGGTDSISLRRYAAWVIYAAVPSALIGALTLTLTNEIASFPLLWVIPLALYLATFIIAFSGRLSKDNVIILGLHGILVTAVMVVWMAPYIKAYIQLQLMLDFSLWIGAFFVACLVMHLRLSGLKPAPEKLTLFYLFVALGGSIGGGFSAFIAPVILSNTYEFYALLIATLLFNPAARITRSLQLADFKTNRNLWAIYAAAFGICIYLVHIFTLTIGNDLALATVPLMALGAGFVLLFLSVQPRVLMVVLLAGFLICLPMKPRHTEIMEVRRNFFGVLKVMDDTNQIILMHGTTNHGSQTHEAGYRGKPLSYFGVKSPVGRIIGHFPSGDVAVVGLGAGHLACYTTPSRRVHFYEIDPDVVDLAKKYFNYLSDCKPASMNIGDGRLAIASSGLQYDVIVLDAFTSDSVPLHLLTSEAVDTYFSRLKEGGVVALHISNRYFELEKPLAAIAAQKGLEYGYEFYSPGRVVGEYESMWFFMTRDKALAAKLHAQGMVQIPPEGHAWTDGYTNLLSVIK